MDSEERMKRILIIEKMKNNRKYSEKLGIKDKSHKNKKRYCIDIGAMFYTCKKKEVKYEASS